MSDKNYERMVKEVRQAIQIANDDVDPRTCEYTIVMKDDLFALVYNDDATHEWNTVAVYKLVQVTPTDW